MTGEPTFKTMRSLLQPDATSKSLVLIQQPIPAVKANSDEHLIRVHSVAPCAGELLWPKNFPVPDPDSKQLVPCFDVAGTIVTAPPLSPFRVGDEVYGRTSYYRTGCAREYAIAVTDELAIRSQQLNWIDSTAVPLSSLTAWQALFVHSGIGDIDASSWKGKRVLVTAASGGVGVWVVQLAHLIGAEVVGTCGPDNVDLVKSLGATEVINYHITELREWAQIGGKKVDVVIDCIGQKSLEDAWWCVRDGGVVVSIFQPPIQMRPDGWLGKDVKDLFFIMSPSGKQLESITKLIDEGKCRPIVDSVWPLQHYKEAFKRLDSGHSKGKIVINLSV